MHRLVLLALLTPILAVGVVLWFLLPGSVAGMSYSPSQFNREAHLQPTYWSSHRATLIGYLYPGCPTGECRSWLLLDAPRPAGGHRGAERPEQGVLIAMQGESGWHHLFRQLAPGLLARPFPGGTRTGQRVSITGTLQGGYTGSGLPVLVPADL